MTFEKELAVVFPGQGAIDKNTIKEIRQLEHFDERIELISELINKDFVELLSKNENLLHENLYSSLLVTLSNSVYYNYLTSLVDEKSIKAFYGYSIGQWTALWASKVLDFKSLILLVIERAKFMDRAVLSSSATLISVLGLPEKTILESCNNFRTQYKSKISVANFNCIGNYSLAVEKINEALAMDYFIKLGATKAQKVLVSGPWHSAFLSKACLPFYKYLSGIKLRVAQKPIIDNTTGNFFNFDDNNIKEHLSKHLDHPVLWEKGILSLKDSGVKTFIECGYGKMLSKFGFYIDRKNSKHIPINKVT